jgi:F420-0:gamma-glutamyl ligase
VPLRRGVSGIALGYAGFYGVNDLRGTTDLYGNKLKVTQQNMADMLAAAAHAEMGEGKESTPFVLINDAPVQFTTKKINPKEPIMSPSECLYAPLYNNKIKDK